MDLIEGGDEGFVVVVAVGVGEGFACLKNFVQATQSSLRPGTSHEKENVDAAKFMTRRTIREEISNTIPRVLSNRNTLAS